jgi:hypothetical protein
MFYMQDSSCYHSFYDVSSKFTFIFFNIFTVSHFVTMDRLSTGNMVVHIYSMACKPFTPSRSDHFSLAYILFPQGKCRRRRAWRPPNDDRQPYRPRYILLQMRDYPWLEICKCPFRYTPLLILTEHVGQGVRTVSEVQGRQIYPWAKSPRGRSIGIMRNHLRSFVFPLGDIIPLTSSR